MTNGYSIVHFQGALFTPRLNVYSQLIYHNLLHQVWLHWRTGPAYPATAKDDIVPTIFSPLMWRKILKRKTWEYFGFCFWNTPAVVRIFWKKAKIQNDVRTLCLFQNMYVKNPRPRYCRWFFRRPSYWGSLGRQNYSRPPRYSSEDSSR